MIVTKIYNGQGLGNQLWCYVVTRVLALDNGYKFGIESPENFKCKDFLDLDTGQTVTGGDAEDGRLPRILPEGIRYYYTEREIYHPQTKADIRIFDPELVQVPDETKIDGVMQDEQYIHHRRDEIRSWLQVREEFVCLDYSDDNICVINFRGGEYAKLADVFLPKSYWNNAVALMLKKNPDLRFVVITDDVASGKEMFPEFDVFHFSIAKDYSIINTAKYLILSNSSFAWFPAWLNNRLQYCIAPKYWARHNVSDGYWSCGYNLTSGWDYLDRNGELFTYEECVKEFAAYKEKHSDWFTPTKIQDTLLVVNTYRNDLSWLPRRTSNYLVYDRSENPIYPPTIDSNKIIRSPNIGYNIYDYCTYIIDHYDHLPERVMFTKGNVFPRHISEREFDRLANNTYFTPIEDYRMHQVSWPTSFFSSDGGFCEINNSWYLRHHSTKYFHSYNDFITFCFKNPVIPRYLRFAPGANYIVPRENILKLPKVFYENLRTFVSHDQLPGEAHIIERSLFTLWTCNFEISESMMKPIDSSFSAKPMPPTIGPSLWQSMKGKLASFLKSS